MGISGKEVLIIDDDPDLRKIASKVFEVAGIGVSEADSVAAGIAKANEKAPHLVILDLKMPNESGFVFLEKRTSIPALKSVPVIVMSAIRDKAAILQAISLGAEDYIVKPFHTAILLQKTRKALRDQAFLSYGFSENQMPDVYAVIPGQIVRANEAGFMLEAPVRIAPESNMKVVSQLLEDFGCQNCKLKASNIASRGGLAKQFLTHVKFVGLTEVLATQIRRTVRYWK